MSSNWLLPEHISDVLPAEARRIEELRRRLLDVYHSFGYEQVAPPIVEYINSLLVGNAKTLDLQTSKLVDQLSGRTLGVRADMTPQVARIDAHLLNRDSITRLCYCGTVLHARPADLLASRELLQIGAEIYGYEGLEADAEIIQLALESIKSADVQASRLDLNHPGVVNTLLSAAPELAEIADDIYALLNEKNVAEISLLLANYPSLDPQIKQSLESLPSLYGDIAVLAKARQLLPAFDGITQALNSLEKLIAILDNDSIGIDLADVRGYNYHSGISFAVFAPGWHDAIVRGGRYDNASFSFGRARCATGFSLDLRKLSQGLPNPQAKRAIKAPWSTDSKLRSLIQDLREQGNIVVQSFGDQSLRMDEFVFTQEIVARDGQWELVGMK